MLRSAAMMRRVLLMVSLPALIAVLLAMWAFRYERSPGLPVWRLADLRAGTPSVPGVEWSGTPDQAKLRLAVDSANSRVSLRLAIPGMPSVAGLHLRFQMSAHGLVAGSEKWQDGRFMVEWHHSKTERIPENCPVASVRDDQQLDVAELVMQSENPPGIPALRLEHLGRSGEFELSDLEITAVQERAIWKTGRWFLAIAWMAWIAAFIRTWPGISRWRALCASSLWVVMGIMFVFPGPWKIQRAMFPVFQLDGVSTEVLAGPEEQLGDQDGTMPVPVVSGTIPALGKIPDQGGVVLRVKHAISSARPLLHVLLLFAPTFAFASLLGWRPALALSVILAISIELAQIGFGYGFDLIDVGDLITDAAGITLALWVWKRFQGKEHRTFNA